MGSLVRLTRSIWFRITVVTSAALMVTLAVVVFAVYELTLILERTELDAVLVRESEEVVAFINDAIIEGVGSGGTITAVELDAIVARALALHPGSSLHLTVVRSPDFVVSSARGPERLEDLRDTGSLPEVPEGRLGSFAGLRARSVELDLADRVLKVETLGDDAAVAGDARSMAARTLVAAGIGALVGLAGLVIAARRSTRGLAGVSATVRRTRLEDLSTRVPEPHGSNEVAVLARDVNAMLDDLKAARSARDELIASVSHELRTPLAAARGHVELLLDGRAADQRVTTDRIDQELRRITRLVDDLLALSRAGDPAWLAKELTSVRFIVDELVERCRGLGVEAPVVVNIPDVVIDVDPDRVLQALSNLVANGYGHNPEGTEVSLRVEVGEGTVGFVVVDDGSGIPDAVVERFGQAFVRGSSSGTGLGLAVTRAVAAAHGGSLEVSSGLWGTEVRLVVPIGA